MGVDLSEALAVLLAERGLTQEDLAERSGMRRTDINAIVKGRVKVGPTRLARIAAALEIPESKLAEPPEPSPRSPLLRELAEIRSLGEAVEAGAQDRWTQVRLLLTQLASDVHDVQKALGTLRTEIADLRREMRKRRSA